MEQGSLHSKRHKKAPHARPVSRESERGSPARLLKHSAIGAGIALACAALLLLITTRICYSTADPNRLTAPVGIALLYLSALLSGLFSVRLHRSAPVPCGLISGSLLMLSFLFFTLFFRGELREEAGLGLSLLLSILMRALIPGISILGALLGSKRKAPRRRSR